jgi:hypothetical protein
MKKMAIHTFLVSTIYDFWPKFHTLCLPTYIGGLRGPIQTQHLGRWANKFESVSNSLGGACLSLNWMAASDINPDAAIQARFSGSVNLWGLNEI